MTLEPKPFPLTRKDGVTVAFILSKFPAIAGREIVSKYPVSNIPKLGDYAVSEEVMLKLMSYVSVDTGTGAPLPLSTRALVDNHAGDWETLARLEKAMLEYNCSFFGNGVGLPSLADILHKAAPWISQTLTALQARSSAPVSPPL